MLFHWFAVTVAAIVGIITVVAGRDSAVCVCVCLCVRVCVCVFMCLHMRVIMQDRGQLLGHLNCSALQYVNKESSLTLLNFY